MRRAVLIAVWVALLSGCCFKVEKNGDFAIEMPESQSIAPAEVGRGLVTLNIRLEADDDGELSGAVLDGQRLVVDAENPDVFALLHRRVRQIVEQEDFKQETPREFEAVIHADRALNFTFVSEALAGISQYTDANGDVRKLVNRIRFAPPNESAADSAEPHKVREAN